MRKHVFTIKQKTSLLLSLALFVSCFGAVQSVSAEELVVSGNGSGSTNTAAASDTSQTTVTSTNTTNVDNTSQTTGTTGNNTISDNSGQTQVTTGDVTTDTTIETKANTTTITPTPCCTARGTMVIVSGNGKGSENTASSSNVTANTLSVQQTATVTNTIQGSANTGGNTASNNTGKVTISTGNIHVTNRLLTGPINQTTVRFPLSSANPINLMVSNNGSSSVNSLGLITNTTNIIAINNVANIFNNVLLSLNTGDNEATGNTGDVTFTTGDILVDTVIETGPINSSEVSVDCHCENKPNETPVVPAPPIEKVTPQNVTNSDKSSSGGTGEVASISASKVLPVTGVNWLILAFIGNVMMLFLGMILRLRSGNAPGKAV